MATGVGEIEGGALGTPFSSSLHRLWLHSHLMMC